MTTNDTDNPAEEAGEPAGDSDERPSGGGFLYGPYYTSIGQHPHKLEPPPGTSQHHKSPPAHTHRDPPPPMMGTGGKGGGGKKR
jgi:hypothetical protein